MQFVLKSLEFDANHHLQIHDPYLRKPFVHPLHEALSSLAFLGGVYDDFCYVLEDAVQSRVALIFIPSLYLPQSMRTEGLQCSP